MVDFEKREINGRRCGLSGPVGPGMILGLLLVTGGTLLLLDNLNILPFRAAKAFWPLALLALSGAWLYGSVRGSRGPATTVWAATGVAAGILLLLGNYDVIRLSLRDLWPLALIATGIVMLIYRLRWRQFTQRFVVGSGSKTRSASLSKLQEFAIFSSVVRKVETPKFEGGELTSVFGAIVIDMRFANISSPDRHATIEANVAFGSIELRVPDTWRVQLQGSAVFGAYEDKTIPPRPEPGIEWPTLVVRGGTAFGAVEIRN
jgi:Domain of unknown function (DUF5668)/Cell wall-active antibiotics response 4TMS YvqF